MRILFVLENYFPNIGGVETLFKSLIEQLVAAGHECTVVTSRLSRKDPLRETFKNLTIVRIPVTNRYLFTLQALVPALRLARNCDLIQTTSYNAALPAFLAAVWRRKKVLVTFHEAWGKLWFQLPYMSRPAKWMHYFFEQLLLHLPFDRFIAVSQSTATRLQEEGVAARRIAMNYNGIDYRDFAPDQLPVNKAADFTFTYFGRLGISKGLDLLLEAAISVQRAAPDSRLQLIVPEVPPDFLNMIKDYIRQNGLEDYVYLRHHLSFVELKQAIRASDCVVIPSYSEGFCFAAVETVALGIPIVSSGRTALQEVVGGRYVEMKTQTAPALVEAMLQGYHGHWQERPVRLFKLEDTVAAYHSLYEAISGGQKIQ